MSQLNGRKSKPPAAITAAYDFDDQQQIVHTRDLNS